MAAQVPAGLAEGALGVLTAPVAIKRVMDAGVNKGLDFGENVVRKAFGAQPISDQDRAARASNAPPTLDQPLYGAADAATNALESVLPTANNRAEKFVRTASSFVPAVAVAGGGIPSVGNVVRQAVIPGVASEAAGQATQGTWAEPYARVGGAVLGGGVGSMIGRGPFAERWTGQAAQGLTPAHYDAAERLMQDAQSRGITLTAAEALQQVSGGASNLGRVQRVIESTREGGDVMAPVMAARPGTIDAATRPLFTQIAPGTNTPSLAGVQLQQGAGRALDQTRQALNRQTDPLYARAAPVQVDPVAFGQLYNDPLFQQALTRVRQDPVYHPIISGLPDDSVGVLDAIKQHLTDAGSEAAQSGRNLAAARYGNLATRVRDAGALASPDYAQALAEQAASRSVGPVAAGNAGPLGTIHSTDKVPAQGQALIPDHPIPGSASETAASIGQLANLSPQAAAQVVRARLEGMYDNATRPAQAGTPSQYGGAQFARDISHPPEKAAAIDAAVGGVAGAHAVDDLRGLADILAATGWRQRPGSMTAFNQSDLADLERGGIVGTARAAQTASANPFGAASDWLARKRMGGASRDIAQLLLEGPTGVRRLQDIAATSGPGPLNEMIARALMQSPTAAGATDWGVPRLARTAP